MLKVMLTVPPNSSVAVQTVDRLCRNGSGYPIEGCRGVPPSGTRLNMVAEG
jgi:hypothetical protein